MGFFGKSGGPVSNNYAGKELSQDDFEGKNLVNADFSGSDLTQVTFDRANLQGASFTNAKLGQCGFTGANLTGAKFDGANVSQCTFTEARLDGMTTNGTKFTQCDDVPAIYMADFDDIDSDDDKYAIARQRLQRLEAIAPGGAIKERRGDDELFFSGTWNGRPFRALVDADWGSVTIEVKTQPNRGELDISYDRDAGALQVDEDPVWDANSDPQVRHFIGPATYIEGPKSDVGRQVALLFGDISLRIAQGLGALNAESFRATDDGNLQLKLRDDVLKGDLVMRVQVGLQFLSMF